MRFSLIKREPSFFFENMHEDLQRFLKDTFGDLPLESQNAGFSRVFRPAVEVLETKDEYEISTELPGVKKEDISVELCKDGVTINAETKFEKTGSGKDVKYSEFRYGKFTRTIPFDAPIDMEKAQSEFKDGVLCIKIKKLENKEENVKKIEVK